MARCRARLARPEGPVCMACSSPGITETSHAGTVLRFCPVCLEIARDVVLDAPEDAPASYIVSVVAAVAQGWARC